MKTSGESLRVDPTARAVDGSKLEPEEMPARESIPTPVDLNIGNRPLRPDDTKPAGSMRGIINIDSSAIDVAQDVATRCELCAHWRHEDWQRHIALIEDTAKGAKMLNALRGELLGRNDILSVDPEDVIAVNIAIRREFGICAAFTETEGMPVGSPYYGGCPENDPRFKLRDRGAQVQASQGYDKVMRLAQGKET